MKDKVVFEPSSEQSNRKKEEEGRRSFKARDSRRVKRREKLSKGVTGWQQSLVREADYTFDDIPLDDVSPTPLAPKKPSTRDSRQIVELDYSKAETSEQKKPEKERPSQGKENVERRRSLSPPHYPPPPPPPERRVEGEGSSWRAELVHEREAPLFVSHTVSVSKCAELPLLKERSFPLQEEGRIVGVRASQTSTLEFFDANAFIKTIYDKSSP